MVFKLFWLGLLFPLQIFACEIHRDLVVMSGPVTMILEELNLLQQPKLHAISSFHPIKNETTAKVIKGGLFLSPKVLGKYRKYAFFFDKSREFKALLRNNKMQEVWEVDTSGADSFKNFDDSLKLISPFLKDCQTRIEKLKAKVATIKGKTQNYHPKLGMLFFLGEITQKYPELIMVNDGLVLALKNYAKLETYVSKLDYVNWSAKEMKHYTSYIKLGLSESGSDEIEFKKVGDNKYNLYFRGVLIPGIRQIYFLEKFIQLEL